jgi:hypothetical protein
MKAYHENPYRYSDSENEYRHVQLPKAMLSKIPKDYFDPETGTLKLLWEEEWRGLGITQVQLLIQQMLAGDTDYPSRVLAGNTMKSMIPSPISCYSSRWF